MKKSTKSILATLVVVGVVGTGVAIAMRLREDEGDTLPVIAPPIDPASLPPEIFGAGLEPGYTTYGWYSYKSTGTAEVNGVTVEGTQKWWIRVDRGPDIEGTVLTDVPWRWTIFVDKPAPVGSVPIATGTKSWTEMRQLEWLTPVPDSVWREYNDEGMGQAVANAASEQIDTMVGGA